MNPKPLYLLAGGGRRGNIKETTRRMALSLQPGFQESGKTAPVVAYLGSASGDNRLFFGMISSMLKQAGAGKVNFVSTVRKNADIQKARAALENADVIFVSGGDVEAGIQVLEEKKMTVFLRDLYLNGKPFLGVSAGSIMLAKEWVRWIDPDDDSTAAIFPCLGLAPVLCDTHGEEGDWEELKALLALEKEGTVGYGIASNAGLKVFPDGRVEAFGGAVNRYINRGGTAENINDLLPSEKSVD